MTNPTALRNEFNDLVNTDGVTCRIRYFTKTFNTGSYDDYYGLSVSGNTWVSGIKQPLDKTYGGKEGLFFEQGIITTNDSKLYIPGDTDTSGVIKIMIGSPSGDEYQVINDAGVIQWEIDNTPIYKKLYVRRLSNGSIYGE